MASALRSHLTVLQDSVSSYGTRSAFRLPRLDPETNQVQSWDSVTYEEFQHDVELFARHWTRVLKADGIPQRSVIGMWIGGMTYIDVLNIYGLTRAGYVPQLFSIRLPNPVVIYELLERANAKGLIYETSFESVLSDCSVPAHRAISISEANPQDEPLPTLPTPVDADELVFIFHTSGSTSGSPKLVPCSRRWMNSAVEKSYHTGFPKSDRDVTVWMGSMCHIGQTFMLIGSLQHGSCTIQPSVISFSPDELMAMVRDCGLNRLNQFAAFLATSLRASRKNPKLLATLKNLDEILYSGLPLSRDEEEWAYSNGMNLRNLFGSTECGAMMISNGGNDHTAPFLRPLKATAYGFFPIASQQASASEAGLTTVASQMVELVILSDSGDCPDKSLRAADGHFHTGDLFLEVQPGQYLFRGRDDDWIKSENSLRCDTKAIEENVRTTCSELISECIVVGNGRPSPALFIEPAVSCDHAKLKRDILRRTRQFHSRRYLHERITSANFIIIVEPGTLPRTVTKGNIRRKAVEEAYKPMLDKLYGVV